MSVSPIVLLVEFHNGAVGRIEGARIERLPDPFISVDTQLELVRRCGRRGGDPGIGGVRGRTRYRR
jgi:hypothetical protein